MRPFTLSISLLISIFISSTLLAHHGSGDASAGLSASVLSAETMENGRFQFSWGSDYSLREAISKEDLEARVLASGDSMQTLDYTLTQTFNLSWGLPHSSQVDVAVGTYRGENFREGHLHSDGSYELHDNGSVTGWRDTSVRLKSRVWQGEGCGLVLALGATLPTGRDDQASPGIEGDATGDTSTGEMSFETRLNRLDIFSQAGHGGTDFEAGLAGSSSLGQRWNLDASALFGFSATTHSFKPGDRLSAGVSLMRGLGVEEGESGLALGMEALVGWSSVSFEDGLAVADSGGVAVAAGPRLRAGWGEHGAFTAAFQVPLVKAMNGNQQKAVIHASLAVAYLF